MSRFDKTDILGVPVSIFGFDPFLQYFDRALRDDAVHFLGHSVNFVNVHTVVEFQHDSSLRQIFREATFNVADGLPLVWVSQFLGGAPIQSRVCGPDVMHQILTRYSHLAHGFVGGQPGQGDQLVNSYGLQNAWTYSPPFRAFSSANAIEDWHRFLAVSGGVIPKVVWVGLGAPKQEKWVAEVRKLAPDTWFFAVGAAFDFLTGTKPRAPLWMQRLGLEWLYRLLSEPRRLMGRYLRTNTEFCVRVALKWLIQFRHR